MLIRIKPLVPSHSIRFYAKYSKNASRNEGNFSMNKGKLAKPVGVRHEKSRIQNRFGKGKLFQDKSRTNYHFGNYSGLKDIDLKKKEVTANILNKITTFESLKILPNVRDAMVEVIADESLSRKANEENTSEENKNKNVTPSPIQVVAIKKLSKTLMNNQLQSHIIAAETGSGKTMAYLIPLVEYLKREEIEKPEIWELQIKNKAVIRSVIMVPTHELVDQVYQSLTKTEKKLDLHCLKWDTNLSYKELINAIKSRVDILVTTPSKILNLFNIRMISRPDKIFSQLKFAVLDEADTLLDKSWLEETHSAIKKLPNLNHLIFCSATIPVEFNKTVERLFPNTEAITTPRLHKLPRSLQFKIIDSTLNPFKGSKIKTLAQTLYAINNDNTEPGYQKRCLVFVNEKKDVQGVVTKMKDIYGHDCVGMTGEDTLDERIAKIKDFISPPIKLASTKNSSEMSSSTTVEANDVLIPGSNIRIKPKNDKSPDTAKTSKLKILVSTDLMARGLNFKGVRNLVLYDVPKTSIDLVHRVGRTARMNQSGRVFMIIDKKTKSWARGLPKAAKNNLTIS